MGRRLVNLTLDNLDDLPGRCRDCVFWELDPVASRRAEAAGQAAAAKQAWVSATLLEWGSCGQLAYLDGDPAGYLLYAPPAYVPRSTGFPTSPVSADAVLLTAARIRGEYRHGGVGRLLVQGMVKDLARRGVRAVEAFGDTQAGAANSCVVPVGYLRAVGFRTVRRHSRYPRLRMDVRAAVRWRTGVEEALERLLNPLAPEPVAGVGAQLSRGTPPSP